MTASVQLQTLAQSHADRMARSGVMSHDAAGDGPFGSRLAASGYRYRAAAENVAWNHPTPAAVMAGWMKSPGHRVNVLGPYSQAGFAVACGWAGDPYWCVVFATPAAASERLAAGEVRTGGDRLEPGQRAFP